MPFCHQCGVELGTALEERFCSSCGADQIDEAPALAAVAPSPLLNLWDDAATRAASFWDEPATRTGAVYIGAALTLALVAWGAGSRGVLYVLPLVVGAVVALAKPQFAVRSVHKFRAWTTARYSQVLTRDGRFSRWLVRPYLGGIRRIDIWTSGLQDEPMRCGVRIAGYLYFTAVFGFAVFVAAYIALVIVVAIIIIMVLLWALGEYLSSDSERRPTYSRAARVPASAPQIRPTARDRILGSSVVREGVLWDTPTGIRVDTEGRVVKEGVLFDSPTGVKIEEEGHIVREGVIFDEPVGYKLDEEGRLVEEGPLWDSETGTRVDEDGRVVREGVLFDEETGVRFKKDR